MLTCEFIPEVVLSTRPGAIMVPGTLPLLNLEVDWLADSILVDDPGWFEGRLHGGGGWIVVDVPQV